MITKPDFCQYYRWFSGLVYYFEMMGYIALGNLNIRIHRDITGEMWFGVRCFASLKCEIKYFCKSDFSENQKMEALYTHRLKVVRRSCKACRGKCRSALILLLLYLWVSSCQDSCFHLTVHCQLPPLPLYHSLLFLAHHRVNH